MKMAAESGAPESELFSATPIWNSRRRYLLDTLQENKMSKKITSLFNFKKLQKFSSL